MSPIIITSSKDDGRMSSEEYRAIIAELGLMKEDRMHADAADALGVSLRTSKSYANGPYGIPAPVAKLLRLWLKIKRSQSPRSVKRLLLPPQITKEITP